jgi:GNAT superfamily N-acetyltransferase
VFSIHTLRVPDVQECIAEQCRNLCHEDSEMQRLFSRVMSSDWQAHEEQWVISYAFVGGKNGTSVAGWASATDWFVGGEVRRQVQLYVDKHYRNRGLGTALCVCLGQRVTKDMGHICVFSPEALRIASRLGWKATQYKHTDDGWIGVATTDGRIIEPRSNDAGLHAPASEMRGLSLACGEEWEET